MKSLIFLLQFTKGSNAYIYENYYLESFCSESASGGAITKVFTEELSALQQFPSKQQGVSLGWKDMSNWIKTNTDKNSIIISSPAELPNFTWVTERSTIVKLKLFSQNKIQIIEQYKRLDDLSGNHSFSNYLTSDNLNRKKTRKILAHGYNSLTTSQAKDLMKKYHASYFLTRIKHNLDFEVAHLQEPYILYFNPIS